MRAKRDGSTSHLESQLHEQYVNLSYPANMKAVGPNLRPVVCILADPPTKLEPCI